MPKGVISKSELARAVTLAEGGKKSVSIAQVAEVQRLTFRRLARESGSKVLALIESYR